MRYRAQTLVVIALVALASYLAVRNGLAWYLAVRNGGPAVGPPEESVKTPSQAEPNPPSIEDLGAPSAEDDSGASPAEDSAADCPPEEQEEEYGMVMVRICGGTFTMGSAGPRAPPHQKPAHQVTVSEFWIGKTEVTNEQYRQVHPDHRPDESGELPATWVSWHDAQEFCQSAGYRLPTEAEWEYAARAGTETPWSFGAKHEDIGRFAWYKGNSGGEAHAVSTREPNPWRLHDMHGNVWEWVADPYGLYSAEPQTDPQGPECRAPCYVALRGGSAWFSPWSLGSAVRVKNSPLARSRFIGFRCVRGPRRRP